jgi:hypothetical protein
MKNDLSEANITLQKEKENGIHKDNLIKLLQSELITAKRTIKTYRKVFLQMQREAGKNGGGIPLLNALPNRGSQSSLHSHTKSNAY